ncbi:hypothetical protein AB0D04_37060 [Streptomyces sp. NPDC048483]|uniref:vWA domain-containing protein n=1 Tax=Streptomyces sp. NPDC048483 TaxID=3154927 RepID=UPI0034304392
MSEYDMGGIGDMAFASGYDERQPVVILLDTSDSMGRPDDRPRIDELNAALVRWFDGVRSQERLRERVEVCLIAFSSQVRVYDPGEGRLVPAGSAAADRLFVPAREMHPPALTADGYTQLIPAVETALTLARERCAALRAQCVPVRRPFIWALTDGAPSDAEGEPQGADELAVTAGLLSRAEAGGECVFQAIGVRGADRRMLEVLAPKGTSMLESLDFGQILDHLFTSSDKVDPTQSADEIHRVVASMAALRQQMNAMSDDLL